MGHFRVRCSCNRRNVKPRDWVLLGVASQANLAACIASGQAQKSGVGAMRIMAGCTFNIGPVLCGFTGYGIYFVGASEKI